MMAGHLPRLAQLIANQDSRFRKRIVRVHVDEAHFIHTAGCELYGLAAFRPAWGKLGEFCVKLGKSVTFQALSGTQPKHVKKRIIEHLLFDEEKICHIKLSSNRPNTVYTTHPIVGNLSDFRNLDFLVPDSYPADLRLPRPLYSMTTSTNVLLLPLISTTDFQKPFAARVLFTMAGCQKNISLKHMKISAKRTVHVESSMQLKELLRFVLFLPLNLSNSHKQGTMVFLAMFLQPFNVVVVVVVARTASPFS